jgi:hypothetical protein
MNSAKQIRQDSTLRLIEQQQRLLAFHQAKGSADKAAKTQAKIDELNAKLTKTTDTVRSTQTVTYRDSAKFDIDYDRRKAQGWTLVSVSAPSRGRVTATRVVTTGLFALGHRKGAGQITATYERSQ